MRIDLPTCGFKNCRYCFDGNCTNKIEYEVCEFQRLKLYVYYTDNIDNIQTYKADANRIAEAVERTKKYIKG
jgi:hypothetical protein